MKIIAKPKHSPYGIKYAFKNKKELQNFVERRKIATGENININSCIYDLLEYCNLELIKNDKKRIKRTLNKENTNYYINGFVDFWFEFYDYIPSDNDCKIEFKKFMENYKNIKIDLRFKLWKDMLDKSMEKILQKFEEKF